MSDFNSREFGNRIKKFREQKGIKLEYLALKLGKTPATISRYESGEIVPNAKDIHLMCDVLGIYESDLYNRDMELSNKENIKNPFDSDTLYMYFNSYNSRKKIFEKDRWIIKILQKEDRCEVNLINYHTNEIYSTGYLLADNDVAFLVMQNHKPNRNRLDVCEVIINVSGDKTKPILGAYLGSSQQHEVSLRKCYFSTKDIDFTDEMLNNLKTKDYEMEKLKGSYALYLDIFNE